MAMRVNQLQGFVVCCPLLHLVNAGKQHPQCQFFRFFPQLLSSPALLGLILGGSSSSPVDDEFQLVICMTAQMSMLLVQAKRISIDTSFKHVRGWQEFEIEEWDNTHQ